MAEWYKTSLSSYLQAKFACGKWSQLLMPTDILSEFPSATTDKLEDILTGRNIRKETEPLLYHKPRNSFGVYNKINFLSSCYNLCRLNNGRRGPKMQRLLCFGGGFSVSGCRLASFMVCVFALLPFAAVWPFVYEKNNLRKDCLLIFTTAVEFVLFLWHFYCVYIIKTTNLEAWLTSWFTFVVKKETLKNTEDSQGSLSLFDMEGKLKIVDVTVTDLCRLNSHQHQITVDEREKLATRIENCRLDQAAIILYSEEFINEFAMNSMYQAFVLASLSAVSFALLTYKTITILSVNMAV